MNLLNIFRNKAFWILDNLNGGTIKNHLTDITSILKDPFCYESILKRELHLNNLLSHATKTVPFYAGYWGKSLMEFPVIRKNTIQENFDQFRSKEFLHKKLYKVATSGSTGMPFILYQNKDKKRRNTADVLYFLEKTNHVLGSRLYELEVWRGHNKKGKLISNFQNLVQYDISVLSEIRINELLMLLKNDRQNKTFLGFSSAYESICKHLDLYKPQFTMDSVNSIIANSEYLNEYTKNSLRRYFKAPVYSRYSNEELGILAHQTMDSGTNFIINHASYFVELLDMETDNPVDKGEFGRIVVTDLFNYAMPLIRYDTGDIAKYDDTNVEIPQFRSIEGRKMDMIYDTKGNIISSFLIYTKFYPYYNQIKQYQFIQEEEKSYTIVLNVDKTFAFEKELIGSFQEDFGLDADIRFKYVNEIPALASGKRKKVVNNYRKGGL